MFRWTCRSSRRNTWTLSSQMWTDFNSPSSDRDRSEIRSDQDLSQIRSDRHRSQISSDRDRSQIRSDQDLSQISSDQDLSQLSSVQDPSQISSDQDNLCNHSLIKRSLFQLTELWPKLADNWTNLISQPCPLIKIPVVFLDWVQWRSANWRKLSEQNTKLWRRSPNKNSSQWLLARQKYENYFIISFALFLSTVKKKYPTCLIFVPYIHILHGLRNSQSKYVATGFVQYINKVYLSLLIKLRLLIWSLCPLFWHIGL